MTLRLAALTVVATVSLLACDATSPSVRPAETTATSAPSGPTLPSVVPSAATVANRALPIDDGAYLAGDAVQVPIDDDGFDWAAPSTAPTMPNGQKAVRVAFVQPSCDEGDVTVLVGAGPPPDAWEEDLQRDGTTRGYTFASWPAAQPPGCTDGQARTYLEIAYHPFQPGGTIHLLPEPTSVDSAPTSVELVPVFTSADATQPWLAMPGFVAQGPLPGAEKPRSASPVEVVSTTFNRATLPDGAMPTRWALQLTGCGPTGSTPVIVTARIGDAEPVEIGSCSDGSISAGEVSWPLPVDGTPVAVLMAGGTTKSQFRVSEFQWRDEVRLP